MNKFTQWTKEVLAEPNGIGSASRLALVLAVGTACFCVTTFTLVVCYLTIKLGHIPDLTELSNFTKGVITLVTGGAGTYGANQLKHLFGNKEQEAPAAKEPEPHEGEEN